MCERFSTAIDVLAIYGRISGRLGTTPTRFGNALVGLRQQKSGVGEHTPHSSASNGRECACPFILGWGDAYLSAVSARWVIADDAR